VRPFDILLELPVELMDRWDMVLAGVSVFGGVRCTTSEYRGGGVGDIGLAEGLRRGGV
tara:strand:+ start:2459 stop:2632 length:174 start_codon:yes stop_codon:yes gene_type:complete